MTKDLERAHLITLIKDRGCKPREHAIQLAGGGSTNIYLDIKGCLSDGRAINIASSALLNHLVRNISGWQSITAFGGPTMGADVLSHGMAARWGEAMKWFSVRSQAKTDHGLGRWIEGAKLGPDDKVILTDDVASTGKSLRDAYRRVNETGAQVVAVMPLVDRGGRAAQRYWGEVPYLPLLTHEDLDLEPLKGMQ